MTSRRIRVPRRVAAAGQNLAEWRDARLAEPAHSTRVAAVLGAALGICLTVCFATGLLSHMIQHPPSWFSWPSRPAGLYRITQGVHIATGVAAIPVLFAKLWSVFPRLFRWPAADDALQAIERLSLLPLVGGSLFMLITGLANIDLWYPWPFFFPAGHYAVSFVVIGSLLIHLVAKWSTARLALERRRVEAVGTAVARRRFLSAVGGMSAALALTTAGQTVWPLRKLALLAPRRPDIGTQGFPVNRTAAEAQVETTASDPAFTLVVTIGSATLRAFSVADLATLPASEAELPIACVEGWSASRRWTGVSIRDVLAAAGAPPGRSVRVESMEQTGRYRSSILDADQAADRDALLATHVDGQPLHIDHGAPLRLIAPNRPGVLQTKWVGRLVVS